MISYGGGMIFPSRWLIGPDDPEEPPDLGDFCECEPGAPAARHCPVCGDPEFFDGTDVAGASQTATVCA